MIAPVLFRVRNILEHFLFYFKDIIASFLKDAMTISFQSAPLIE